MRRILDLHDLMIEQLREMYDAEVELTSFMDKIIDEVRTPLLSTLIAEYCSQTSDNHWVLKQVFNDLFTQKRGEKSTSIRQIMEDTTRLIKHCSTLEVREATVILGIQHIIHFKIATYGALCTYAKVLGLYEDGQKLHKLLNAEKSMDRKLAVLAEEQIDRKAYHFE